MHLFSVTSTNIAIKTRLFGLYFCRRQYRSIFNHFDVICPKATEFGEIMLNKGHYAVQGRQIWCQSQDAISELTSYLHSFPVIADYWPNFAFNGGTHSFRVNP